MPCQSRLTELFKVLVVLPECEVVALSLEACGLVEDAQVSGTLIGTELVSNLLEKLKLVLRKALVFGEGFEVRNRAVFLDSRLLPQQASMRATRGLLPICWTCLAQVIDLVLLEAGDEDALVLVQDEFGYELANSLNVEQLDDVYLIVQLLRSSLIPL